MKSCFDKISVGDTVSLFVFELNDYIAGFKTVKFKVGAKTSVYSNLSGLQVAYYLNPVDSNILATRRITIQDLPFITQIEKKL